MTSTAQKINQILFEVKKLKNLTSEINLLKNQADSLVEAIEFDHEHIAFEVAGSLCRKGQLVHIEGLIHIKLKTIKFQAHGKISEITELGNKRMKVSVELHSYDKELWAEFSDSMAAEQKKIDQLLRSIKGEEE